MKKFKTLLVLAIGCLFLFQEGYGQEQEVIYIKMANQKNEKTVMKTFLIEREIPEAGKLTPEDLKGISQKSCRVLTEMGDGIEWLHSYVTDNKVYCVYRALNEELINEHAAKGGFPANLIQELSTKIGPGTANN